MTRLPPLLAIAATLALLWAAPAAAQGLPSADNIARMDIKQLGELAASITTSVGQDTLKLQPAAKARNCLELTRAANSFALGYGMLGEMDAVLAGKPPKEAAGLRANVMQSRLITFAARVKAEEWLSRICVGFVPPPEHAGEPRYAAPVKLQDRDFTTALIEARQVAENNLAIAVSAGMSKSCPATFAALESIQLLTPYLDKLVKDVAKRPQALGPRASRRGLEVARVQLVNAGNKLYREVGMGCSRNAAPAGKAGPGTAAPGAAPSAPPSDAAPAEPAAPATP